MIGHFDQNEMTATNKNRRAERVGLQQSPSERSDQELPPAKTVTARRFCDQHEISLQTATGRSLP